MVGVARDVHAMSKSSGERGAEKEEGVGLSTNTGWNLLSLQYFGDVDRCLPHVYGSYH